MNCKLTCKFTRCVNEINTLYLDLWLIWPLSWDGLQAHQNKVQTSPAGGSMF